MSEDNGNEAGGLDTSISNDIFGGSDIAETMEKAYDENPQEPVPVDEGNTSDKPRDDQGKFVKEGNQEETSEEEASEEAASEESESTQEDPVPTRDVPLGWDKDKEEDWKSMSESQQGQFIKRNNQFAAKIQQSVEGKKFADSIKQVEAPYQAMIAAEGANTVTAYQDYLKTSYQLRNGTPEQKVNLVMQLAKTFNVPLTGLNPTLGNDTENDIYVDPDIQNLQNVIGQLNSKIEQMEQRTLQEQQNAQNAEMQSIDSEISNFASDPKHPHFEAVRPVMGALMTSGVAENMEAAYDMAVHADPKLRADALKSVKIKEDTERTKQAQIDADNAQKTAGTNLTSKGSGGKKLTVAKTQDETMSDAYDRAMAK